MYFLFDWQKGNIDQELKLWFSQNLADFTTSLTVITVKIVFPPFISDLKHLQYACKMNPLDEDNILSVKSVPLSHTVMVKNLNPMTQECTIFYFFSNKSRNSGGPVSEVIRLDDTCALVHFENEQGGLMFSVNPLMYYTCNCNDVLLIVSRYWMMIFRISKALYIALWLVNSILGRKLQACGCQTSLVHAADLMPELQGELKVAERNRH